MNKISEKPLITFLILAYNQQRFIREAVEGAFAQTYSPLEIIISDDCSSDRTFEIIKEMAAAYSGPHRVVLNRNKQNLGIGEHVNRVMEISEGEIIVASAGDDISLPERTTVINETFQSSNGQNMLVFSDFQMIDEYGNYGNIASRKMSYDFKNPIELCRHYFHDCSGASCAWSRKIYNEFGPMLPEVTFEDSVHFFRAALLGTIQHISKPLVLYRRHGTNICEMFRSRQIEDHNRRLLCTKDVYRNNARDLEIFASKNKGNDPIIRKCRSVMRRRVWMIDARLNILSGQPLKMIIGLVQLVLNGGHPARGIRLVADVLSQRR